MYRAPLKKVMALDDIRWIFLFWVFDITTFLEGEVHFHAPIDTATWLQTWTVGSCLTYVGVREKEGQSMRFLEGDIS